MNNRFWNKVDASGDCWLWIGATFTPKAYGQFRVGKRLVKAHRYAWEDLVGKIPPDMTIDHLCRVKLCVNPDHLEVVTASINSIRGMKNRIPKPPHVPQKRGAKRKEVCKRGHLLAEARTYRRGHYEVRACRKCQQLRSKLGVDKSPQVV